MTTNRVDPRSWGQRGLDAISQLFNWMLLNGDPDETISGRSYRNTTLRERKGLRVQRHWVFLRAAAELLFFWQDGQHTRLAFEADLERHRRRSASLP